MQGNKVYLHGGKTVLHTEEATQRFSVEGIELHENLNEPWWLSEEDQRLLKTLRRRMK